MDVARPTASLGSLPVKVVFGMPGVAVGAGLADAVLPLENIASHFRELVAP